MEQANIDKHFLFKKESFLENHALCSKECFEKILQNSIYIDNDVYYIDRVMLSEILEKYIPSKFSMFKNIIQAAKDAISSGLDVRDPIELKKALTICSMCPSLIEDGPRCGICGCHLKYKTSLKAWHCPLNKW